MGEPRDYRATKDGWRTGRPSSARMGDDLNPETKGVDAERELPNDLGNRRDPLHDSAGVVEVEQHAGPREGLERTSDQSQQRQSPRRQAGPVHQVAQDEPVPDPDNPAGPELERPV